MSESSTPKGVALRRAVPLLAGWALILAFWKIGAPPWSLALVVLAQVASIVVGSLGLAGARSTRFALALTVFYLLSLVLLPLAAVETSLHEADSLWRIPQPAAEEEP
ncbi:MAG: hypothetical protein AAGA81_08010 [Acidobacteriota bacterium]